MQAPLVRKGAFTSEPGRRSESGTAFDLPLRTPLPPLTARATCGARDLDSRPSADPGPKPSYLLPWSNANSDGSPRNSTAPSGSISARAGGPSPRARALVDAAQPKRSTRKVMRPPANLSRWYQARQHATLHMKKRAKKVGSSIYATIEAGQAKNEAAKLSPRNETLELLKQQLAMKHEKRWQTVVANTPRLRFSAPDWWDKPSGIDEASDTFDKSCVAVGERASKSLDKVSARRGACLAAERNFAKSLFELRAQRFNVQPCRRMLPIMAQHPYTLLWHEAHPLDISLSAEKSGPLVSAGREMGGDDRQDEGRRRKKWKMADSVWHPRGARGLKSFYEDDELLRRTFEADWRMAIKSHALENYIMKNDDEVGTWRDEDNDGVHDEILEVKDALWRNARAIYGAFDWYASNDSEGYDLSFNAFMGFVRDCAFVVPMSKSCKVSGKWARQCHVLSCCCVV